MAKWDGGAYAETVVNGRKEDGTDVHSVNRRVMHLNTRDNAKTGIYALLYGAGDYKLGTIVYDDFTDDQRRAFNAKYRTKKQRDGALRRLGGELRARMMEGLPAFGALVEAVKKAVKERGHLRGLDGRLLHVRSEHAALNTLLQSAGALVMKKALVILDSDIVVRNYPAFFVANVHDEWQIDTREDIAHEVGKLAADAIRRAGEHFKFRCPLSGNYAVGRTWAGTH
jgi:DNA polymerase I-like protein with 3'-5' exonuclease and polymerase domains